MFVTRPENWYKLKENNEWPIRERYKKTAQDINIGDEIVVYLSNRLSSFVSILKVTQKLKEERPSFFFQGDFYNYTIKFKPIIILNESKLLPIKNIVHNLKFIKNKKILVHNFNWLFEKYQKKTLI